MGWVDGERKGKSLGYTEREEGTERGKGRGLGRQREEGKGG